MSHYRPYPVYNDSGVEWAASAPEHWRRCRLKHVVGSLEQGWSPQCEARPAEPDEWGVLKVGCVNGGVFNPAENKALPLDVEPQQGLSLRMGDVLVSRANTRELVGGCALVERDYPKLILCDKLYRLRPKRSTTSDYLSRLVQVFGRAEVEVEASGTSASMVNISMETVRNLRIVVPPHSEQAEITPAIDRETARIDALIAKKTRFIDLLKEKRRALITHAVTKGRDPSVKMKDSGVEWIGEVPEHWEVSKLAYTTREAGGKTPDTKNQAYWGGSVPWVSPKDMKQSEIVGAIDTITDAAVQECGMRVFAPGTLLAVVRGMILAHSFPVATLVVPATINQDMKALEPDARIRANYLRLILEAAKDYVVSILVAEAAHGTRVLRTDVWRQLPALLPPVDEQDAILDALDRVGSMYDKLIERVEKSVALLKERRASLITAAVTGQIDLRSPTESTP